MSDFAPTAPLAHLRRRAELLRQLRAFFDARGFLEIETPVLSHDTVVDRHLDPWSVRCYHDARHPEDGPLCWLQTSPEFAMKRALATYGVSLYQVTHAFRAGESGRLHNPEFTMVEWYEVGADLEKGMRLLAELADHMLERRPPTTMLTYAEAFQRWAGVDPHRASVEELADAGRRQGKLPPESLADRDGWLEWLLVECVEPHLGRAAPLVLYDYPASQAALARVREGETPVAERFELYVDGVELANGYHELLDASVLTERNRTNNAWRAADGKGVLPENSRLLDAMRAGLPACAGVALGFDRLVMIALGAQRLDEVLAFPFSRA